MRSMTLWVLLAVSLITVGGSSAAAAQSLRRTASVSVQSQDGGGALRSGAAISVGVWRLGNHWLHQRIEIGLGGYALPGGGTLCAAVYPSGCGGPGGFPRLLAASASVVVGRMEPKPGPYALAGVVALLGFGNENRRDRRALTPDIGAGLPTGSRMFVEARYRWLTAWEGRPFQQALLAMGWRGS